jgi:hypothetical protein
MQIPASVASSPETWRTIGAMLVAVAPRCRHHATTDCIKIAIFAAIQWQLA